MLLTAKVRSRAKTSFAAAMLSTVKATTANRFRRIGHTPSGWDSVGCGRRQGAPTGDDRGNGRILGRQIAPVALVHQLVVDGRIIDRGDPARGDQLRHQAETKGEMQISDADLDGLLVTWLAWSDSAEIVVQVDMRDQ